MIEGLAYTSSLLFLAAICLAISLGPIFNGRAIVFPLSSVVTSLVAISLWFFALMALSSPFDYYGIFSVEAWKQILLQFVPAGVLLFFVWRSFGKRAVERYEELTKGYLVFGPSIEVFRATMRKALGDLGLQYAETEVSFYIQDLAAELKVRSLPQPAGMHVFGFQNVSFNQVAKQIADGLAESFSTVGGSVDTRACLRFSAVGILFLFLGVTKG